MAPYRIDKQGEQPPDLDRDTSTANGELSARSEWPYLVFVAGLFLLITLRALLFA
jgi:hypothetical protein